MITLANVVHRSGIDANHPTWDTMVALHNNNDVFVRCRIQIFRERDGSLVLFGSDIYFDVLLEPHLTWAASFIPNNGFGSNPPQDFSGHATVDCSLDTPFGWRSVDKILPFALAAFSQWSYGVNVLVAPRGSSYPQIFPYAIPHFDDSSGVTRKRWLTGITIQNPRSLVFSCDVLYTVAQTYSEKGKTFGFNCIVPRNGGLRFDLMTGDPTNNVPGLIGVGYPANLNSEGHLVIDDHSGGILIPSLIIASDDYSFMVGEEPQ